jgi:hypothetical protein
MTVTRIAHTLGATAITGVLAFTAYTAQAGATAPPTTHATHATHAGRHAAPAPHRYGADGMRMGLHCDSTDMSMP